MSSIPVLGTSWTASVANLVFSTATSSLDVLTADAKRDIYRFTFKPPLKITPGNTETTEAFHLEQLPQADGSGLYLSVSITGWKNTGSDPGDQFSIGAGFNAR